MAAPRAIQKIGITDPVEMLGDGPTDGRPQLARLRGIVIEEGLNYPYCDVDGGGLDGDRIVGHVLAANAGYLRSLGQTFRRHDAAPLGDELQRTRAAIHAALVAGARG